MGSEEDIGSFIGDKLKYRSPAESAERVKELLAGAGTDTSSDDGYVADEWQNLRPVCPYGCDQEGTLTEIIVTPGKGATGLYKDSVGLVFTAPMKMRPKPSSKKIVIGPDGEPQLTEGGD